MPAKQPPESPPVASGRQVDRQVADLDRGGLMSGPWLGLLFALLGGALSWAFLQQFDPIFRLPDHLANFPVPAPLETLQAQVAAQKEVDLKNAVVVLGLFGALLAGSLAVGEGLARRSLRIASVGALGCALVGAVFGGLGGFLGHLVFQMRDSVERFVPLAKTTGMQGIMLATAGVGVGLALGMLSKRGGTVATCMLGGLLAGLLAAMVFPILAASLVTLAAEFGAAGLMPDANTELIIPKGAVIRLLWLGLTAGLLGLTIPGLAAKRAPRAGRRVPAAEADA